MPTEYNSSIVDYVCKHSGILSSPAGGATDGDVLFRRPCPRVHTLYAREIVHALVVYSCTAVLT